MSRIATWAGPLGGLRPATIFERANDRNGSKADISLVAGMGGRRTIAKLLNGWRTWLRSHARRRYYRTSHPEMIRQLPSVLCNVGKSPDACRLKARVTCDVVNGPVAIHFNAASGDDLEVCESRLKLELRRFRNPCARYPLFKVTDNYTGRFAGPQDRGECIEIRCWSEM